VLPSPGCSPSWAFGEEEAAGATHAIIAPTPRHFARFEPQRIEEIARSLELARRAENV
jgi:hypothetical protein